MSKKLQSCVVLLIFTGSVFITSGKFVNATNTPKLYFVIATLLVVVAINAIHTKKINRGILSSKATLWGINIICFIQACYGLCQFAGWLPSNHSKFAITGSFDNPAGFASVLAIGFPISLFLHSKSKNVAKYLASIILLVLAIAVFFSESRTGMLSILISSIVFVLFQANIVGKFRQFRYCKLLTIVMMICLLSGAYILYLQKKDSANGRLLIWKVSAKMIRDKPILGHGYGAFQSGYMDYQAAYFKNNPGSNFSQLADNVKHPFNEFIKVAVEFGLIGLAIILSIILFVLWKLIKSKHEKGGLVLSGLASFLVFACFSYPLQYVAVWVLLAFYILMFLPSKEISINNTPITVITRGAIFIACVLCLFYTCKQVNAEMKWKTIAMNSLRGNTKKMLPEYKKLYSTSLKQNPFFLYNYGAELNVAGKFDTSIEILTECKKRFNDYDLQMLLADNYYQKGEVERAIEVYKYASNMVPCRFLPLYNQFEIYKETAQYSDAAKCANDIASKKIKVPSYTIRSIKAQAENYLKESEKQVW